MKVYRIFLILIFMIISFSGCTKNTAIEDNTNSDIIELSQEVIKENEITTIIVEEKPVETFIKTNGEIKRDEDKFYTISSLVQGRIISAPVKLGDYVKEGQIVAYIQNPEITRINAATISSLHENRIAVHQAETKFNLAKQNYEREKKLYAEGISPKKDLLQAESDYLIAKDDLNNCKERDIHIKQEAKAIMASYGVKPNFDTENLAMASPLTAMKSGIVTKKNITIGAIVSPEQILYEVTDMQKLWLDIILYANDIVNVKQGEKIEFRPDSIKNKIFSGKIDYIQPISNDLTQTYTARTFIDNKDGILQPGMFGEVKIISDKKENKPFIPIKAVQKYGKETFVFLDLGDGKYKKQLININEKTEDGYYVDKGISAGDKIVENGSFTLKSEMLKSEFAEED